MEIDKSKVIKVPPIMIKEGSEKEEREDYDFKNVRVMLCGREIDIKSMEYETSIKMNKEDIEELKSMIPHGTLIDYKTGCTFIEKRAPFEKLGNAMSKLKEQMFEFFRIADIANKLK